MDPRTYYDNNFVKTQRLLDHLLPLETRVVFSSSAAVYGEPVMTPCNEVDPVIPISPYGESKAMIEWMLASYARAYGLRYVSFRYFNACGADSLARHGQEPGATHIIARVLESLLKDTEFHLYGNKYPTADGTCVRDYVHVQDLADAHVLAANRDTDTGVYNLGTGHGVSNQEIMEAAQRITGRRLKVSVKPVRPGDPAVLTADAGKFTKASGWTAQYDLDSIIQHAWAWYQKQS
jgi:UDP-glucose 4-epimerase